MSIFQNVSLIKVSFTHGHREKGSWVEGDRTETPFKGSWQPASGKTLELLPEGKRSREVYKAFAPISLNFTAADAHEGLSGDRVIWEGKEYEVTVAAKWNNGLLPHWELLCTREKEGAA
jgi:hypothetical protein